MNDGGTSNAQEKEAKGEGFTYYYWHRYSWRNNSTGCVTESYKYQMKHSAARLWKVRDLYFDLKG